jgi:hypothetical protein
MDSYCNALLSEKAKNGFSNPSQKQKICKKTTKEQPKNR